MFVSRAPRHAVLFAWCSTIVLALLSGICVAVALAREHETPVTFRAAGTSLSGQACTDSVLLKLSHNGRAWRRYEITDEGE